MEKQPEFTKSIEVQNYWRDTESLSKEWHANNMQGWHVTEKWVKIFQAHYETLLPFANDGDAMAQYAVATIYLTNYLYASEDEAIKNLERDKEKMSKWLELAAKQGVLGAIDNLITDGVGNEADKLKALYNANLNKAETSMEELENNLLNIYNIAYEKES